MDEWLENHSTNVHEPSGSTGDSPNACGRESSCPVAGCAAVQVGLSLAGRLTLCPVLEKLLGICWMGWLMPDATSTGEKWLCLRHLRKGGNQCEQAGLKVNKMFLVSAEM